MDVWMDECERGEEPVIVKGEAAGFMSSLLSYSPAYPIPSLLPRDPCRQGLTPDTCSHTADSTSYPRHSPSVVLTSRDAHIYSLPLLHHNPHSRHAFSPLTSPSAPRHPRTASHTRRPARRLARLRPLPRAPDRPGAGAARLDRAAGWTGYARAPTPTRRLQENLDAEIMGVVAEEAREAYREEVVVELRSDGVGGFGGELRAGGGVGGEVGGRRGRRKGTMMMMMRKRGTGRRMRRKIGKRRTENEENGTW